MSTRYTRAADKELNEKHTKILLELLQKPENKQCADCKKKDPRWASWNLGLFICIRCSGTHRSLGTHISKVKSVDLDTWIPEQIENMVNMGNQKANTYWEARLNGKLPTDRNIDAWIRAKYQHKKWTQDGPSSEPTIQKPLETPLENKAPRDDKENIQTAVPQLAQVKKVLEQIEIKKTPQVVFEKSMPVETLNKSHHAKSSSVNPSKSSPIDFTSFQQQLSGLSTGQTNSGLIPKAPPGSNQSWTNFLNGQLSTDTTNNILSQPSTEKPLIPLDAFANLLKQ